MENSWYFMAPDKPTRVNEGYLPKIDNEWIAEVKADGFRCEAGRFSNLHFISRNENKLEVSNQLIAECGFIPEGCAFDTELICPTRIKAINKQFGMNIPLVEKLMVFDVTWYGGEWISRRMTLEERRSLDIFQRIPQGTLDSLESNDRVFRAPCVPGIQAHELFKAQKAYLISEGIVVKKLRSRGIGGRTSSQDTKDWLKIKHRD